jgi:hypothetical protein
MIDERENGEVPSRRMRTEVQWSSAAALIIR